jgi:hypothetical protein
MKRNKAKQKQNCFRFDAKKVFFCLFRIDVKRRNLKRNENGTKRKPNEKEAKNCHHFRFETKMKRNGSEKLPSFSL